VLPTHAHHAAVLAAVSGEQLGLAGHAVFETYSVLTRLPAPQRLSGALAARVIHHNFPHTQQLAGTRGSDLLTDFAAAGITGAAVYDGLIGACAAQSGSTLVSCDRRAMPTYGALGVDVLLVG